MNELIQQAVKQHDIHVIAGDGMGYTLYCVDMQGYHRFFIEAYEELGDYIVYHQGKVYNHGELDEVTLNMMDEPFTDQYRQKQVELGKNWFEEDEA
jgi:hypothetical protein